MRRAGIDPGSVRTGVAVAEDEVPVATPLCTLKHRGLEDAVQQLAELVKREAIGQVVIGLPLHLDGREGESARRARLFARRLEALARVPVVLWDERLSTVSAARAIAEARYTPGTPGAASGRGRPSRRSGARSSSRERIDETAATLILQSYLDSTRERTWQADPSTPPNEPPDGDGQPG